MKNLSLICTLILGFVLSWSVVIAEDGFYVIAVAAKNANNAPVEKTGQTTCYDEFNGISTCTDTGQDGEHQNGATWPNPRFTDNGDGTVTDNLTGLIWLKDVNCLGQNNWQGALESADSLYDGSTVDGSGGDCGLSDRSSLGDWRLPNVRELQSLIHYGIHSPAVPNTAGTGKWTEDDPFKGIPATGIQSTFWSSSTDLFSPSRAWYLHMAIGAVNPQSKTYLARFWPVRGGD
ncbi:DUF1566 domain-containing protein [bacterium]|nr:DUF1566 domain-containing protein [bacterium]